MKAMETSLIEKFDYQSNAFYYAGNNLADGMLDPRDTRKALCLLLETFRERQQRQLFSSSFGVARL